MSPAALLAEVRAADPSVTGLHGNIHRDGPHDVLAEAVAL